MTLTYHGKPGRRQTLLATVTFFAIAIGVATAGGLGGISPAARINAITDDSPLPTITKVAHPGTNPDATTGDASFDITVHNNTAGAVDRWVTIHDATAIFGSPGGCAPTVSPPSLTCQVFAGQTLSVTIRQLYATASYPGDPHQCQPGAITNVATLTLKNSEVVISTATATVISPAWGAGSPACVPQTGTVIVKKIVSGDAANATDQFGGTVNGPTPQTFPDLSANNSKVYADQPPGSYTVSETDPAPYTRLGYAAGSGTSQSDATCPSYSDAVTTGSPVQDLVAGGTVVFCVYNHKDAAVAPPTVAKTQEATPISSGRAHWTITITNTQANNAAQPLFTVTDLGAQLDSVSTANACGAVLPDTDGTFNCSVAANSVLTLHVSKPLSAAAFPNGTCQPGTIDNIATASTGGAAPVAVTVTPTNTSIPVEATAAASCVTIAKTQAANGSANNYTITLTNTGPATTVLVKDTFNNGGSGALLVDPLVVTSTPSSAACTVANLQGAAGCTVNIAASGSTTLAFSSQAVANSSCSGIDVVNSTSATWATSGTALGVTSGQLLQVSRRYPGITCAPGLTISKTGPDTAVQGTDVAYTLTLTNTGNSQTSGTITVVDTLPAGTTYASGGNGTWTCTNGVPEAGKVSCLSSTPIAADGGTSSFPITIHTPANVCGPIVNAVAASGGGDGTPSGSKTTDMTGCTGTVVVHKVYLNSNADSATFSGSISGSAWGPITAGNSQTINNVPAGTVYASETVPAGYTLIGTGELAQNACGVYEEETLKVGITDLLRFVENTTVAGDPFTVVAGQTTHIYFCNEKQSGTIIVKKVKDPTTNQAADGSEFGGTVSDAAGWGLITFGELSAAITASVGNHTVAETQTENGWTPVGLVVIANWDRESDSCPTEKSAYQGANGGSSTTAAVASGETTLVCVMNTKNSLVADPSIKKVKIDATHYTITVHNGGDLAATGISVSDTFNQGATNQTILTAVPNPATGSCTVAGNGLSFSCTGLTAPAGGDLVISVTMSANSNTSSCSDQTVTNTVTGTYEGPIGTTFGFSNVATHTFSTTRTDCNNGTIAVKKVRDPGASSFADGSLFSGTVDAGSWGSAITFGGVTVPLSVAPGNHTVAETAPGNGWTLVGYQVFTNSSTTATCSTNIRDYTSGAASVTAAVATGQLTLVCVMNTKIPQIPVCTSNCSPLILTTPTPGTTPVVPPTPVTTEEPKKTVEPKATPTLNAVAGEKTPGPGALSTPIAPSTGSGVAGTAASFNGFLALIGVAILGAGMALMAAGRRNTRN